MFICTNLKRAERNLKGRQSSKGLLRYGIMKYVYNHSSIQNIPILFGFVMSCNGIVRSENELNDQIIYPNNKCQFTYASDLKRKGKCVCMYF